MKRWIDHLRETYRHGPVLVLGSIGLLAILAGLFTDGWWQAVLVEIGAALLLIPPIVVTERLILADDVRLMTKQALQQVSRLREDLSEQQADIVSLFTAKTDYLSSEGLDLFRESSRRHHISKWGIAVPLIRGRYDLLLGIHFSDRYEGNMAHVLPSYVIDAQSSLNARVLVDEDTKSIFTEMVWNTGVGETTASLLRRVRDDLLDRGLHPEHELDFMSICEDIKRTLILREEARSPGTPYRSNLGRIICVVGEEIVITTEGIEHLTERDSEPIPLWATFNKAGLSERETKEDRFLSNKYWIEKSGLQKHPDINNALSAVRALYRSRFLRGLYDHRLEL